MADERLIVALDFNNMDDVKKLVNELGDDVIFYKVGMELFYSVGAEAVKWLKEQGKKVFLDLKLFDIPNTVAGGLCSLMNLGADILKCLRRLSRVFTRRRSGSTFPARS